MEREVFFALEDVFGLLEVLRVTAAAAGKGVVEGVLVAIMAI